ESRLQAEKEAEETHALLIETERLKKELEAEWNTYHDQKSSLAQKAKAEAKKIVEEAQREAETVISELRNLQMNTQATIKEHELIDAKKRLDDALPEADQQQMIEKKENRSLAVGDEVNVLQYGQKGTIVEKKGTDEWIVQIGILKMGMPEEGLEYIKPKKEKAPRAMVSVKNRSNAVKLELDLRGERYEEALRRTEKYIDDALLSNYHQVSIIHGKGTGALRQGVQQLLKRHSRVKSFRFGDAAEGGHGVAVVELK